jgi:WD40 repeat protein
MSSRRKWLRSCLMVISSLIVDLAQATEGVRDGKPKVEVVPLLAHPTSVSSIAFSSIGARVLSGSDDGTLKLWEFTTGRLLRTFATHSDVVSVAFSPDGTRVLSGGYTTLQLWDAETGRRLHVFETHSKWHTQSVAFSPNGSQILSTGGEVGAGAAMLWDTETARLIRTFQIHSGSVESIAFSPNDGANVLAGCADGTLKFWNTKTGRIIQSVRAHSTSVTSVAYSPDGTHILSGGYDGTLNLWNAATGLLIHSFRGHSRAVSSVAFSQDGTRVISSSHDTTITVWDAATGQPIRTIELKDATPNSVAFSLDGSIISGNDDHTLKVWDAKTGMLTRTFAERFLRVKSVAFGPYTSIISGNDDNTLKLWDTKTGRLIRTFKGHSDDVNSVAFSPDGASVLSGSNDTTLKLWDVATGRLLYSVEGLAREVTSVAFSPNGAFLLSGHGEGSLKLWSAQNGQLVRTFKNSASWCSIGSVAFSRDGTQVLSGCNDDYAMRLWNVETGRLIHTFHDPNDVIRSVAFSPKGNEVVAGARDGTLSLWNTSTGRLLRTFGSHSEEVTSLAFSPDGARVVSCSQDATLKLWDTTTGELVRTFEGHSGRIESVAYSSSGALVLSGSDDSTIKIWNVVTGATLVTLFASPDSEEWLAMTPEGFFATSAKGTEMLGVVRGLEAFSIMQFYDHLYRPDLIEQLLKGDPLGKYKDAASKINLEEIHHSGPAPQIEQIPERKIERTNDTIKLTLRLVDAGGGIGNKVVWRVNGVSQDEDCARTPGSVSASSGFRVVTQCLKVDPSQKSIIEVTAYNGAGLLATEPYRIEYKDDSFGATTQVRPRMYVLAVGVSKYANTNWHLDYAENDAKAIADTLRAVGRGLYDDVQVATVLDEEATAKGIEAAIDRMKNGIRSNDVFVLYVAGHGVSVAGTYYFLPQDLQFTGGRTVMSDGISQDALDSWIRKIPAQKSILILDTCQSATATRDVDPELVTAIDRLQHATGRSVITAASSSAIEGYNNHGLLTYVVLEALTKTDKDDKDEVTLSQVADRVDHDVPIISKTAFGIEQWPHNKIEGNFVLGKRVSTINDPTPVIIPKSPTHVLIREELLRKKPSADAEGEQKLAPGTQVRVVESVGNWVVIAREGQRLGYVPAESLARLQ